MRRSAVMFAMVLGIGVWLIPAIAFADVASSVNNIPQTFSTNMTAWVAPLQTLATRLFWLLALIEFCVLAFRAGLKQSEFGEWVVDLTSYIMFIGFYAALLQYGNTWMTAIGNSFRQAAQQAGAAVNAGSALAPGDILATALTTLGTIWKAMSLTDIGLDLELTVAGVCVLICLGMVAALQTVALVEFYFASTAGTFFFGFGGCRFSKDFAVKVINWNVSVGAKLFCMQLICAVGVQVVNGVIASPPQGVVNGAITIGGVCIVLFALVKEIPSLIQGLINGSSFSAGSAVFEAAKSIAGGVAGAAVMGTAAAALAGKQTYDAIESGSSGGGAGQNAAMAIGEMAIGMPARMAGNLAGAALADIGGQLSGQRKFGSLGMPGRVAMDMLSGIGRKPAPEEPVSARGDSASQDAGVRAAAWPEPGSSSGGGADSSARSDGGVPGVSGESGSTGSGAGDGQGAVGGLAGASEGPAPSSGGPAADMGHSGATEPMGGGRSVGGGTGASVGSASEPVGTGGLGSSAAVGTSHGVGAGSGGIDGGTSAGTGTRLPAAAGTEPAVGLGPTGGDSASQGVAGLSNQASGAGPGSGTAGGTSPNSSAGGPAGGGAVESGTARATDNLHGSGNAPANEKGG